MSDLFWTQCWNQANSQTRQMQDINKLLSLDFLLGYTPPGGIPTKNGFLTPLINNKSLLKS